MASFIDHNGETQQLPIALSMYRQAADNNMSFRQFINATYPTQDAKKYGSTFNQILASEGIFVSSNAEYGIRASNLDAILNGRPQINAGVVTKEGSPTTRFLFPAALMAAVEDKLVANLNMSSDAFGSMVALDDSISNDRFERPVLNFSKPEAARSQVITQLATPAAMLSITLSAVTRAIPTRSLGLEISEQAMKASTLDLVALALARQRATERNERSYEFILAMLNGDTDTGDAALSTLSAKVIKANTLDTSIVAAGVLTQRAWMKWINTNSAKRTITAVVTDIDGALAIEGRTGKPVITGDNPNSTRIDTIMRVLNPGWGAEIPVFITQDPNWPANTIMGIDTQYGIHRVTSTSASYEAIEAFALKRSTAMRFDTGEIAYRLFDDAFEVLSLTL